MCGIAGILTTKPDQHSIAPALAAMQQSLSHRGPDGRGDYVSPSKQAALTHTRLSIIDLSESGSQPMNSADSRYTISYNGEIYNYQELRKELELHGHTFTSQSDTEVILALYSKFGAQCVDKLRGMFAFLIWDEKNCSAFAARDPLGIKPLYYWHSQTSFAFASELRAIVASGLSKQTISGPGLFSYLQSGTVSEPYTLLNDISMLPAGHTLQWDAGNLSVEQYWKLRFGSSPMTQTDAIALTRAALEDSVRAHFVSDVPVGIFLSGGIDSTALVALATQVTNKQINTYSIAFENPEWDESHIARQVADHFGTHHTEFLMTPEQAKPLFDEFLSSIDQPTIDGFNTFCVAKLARDKGAKVVLSGIGGDELFAGYKSFDLLPKMVRLSKALMIISPLVRIKAWLLNRLLSAQLRRTFDFIGQPGSLLAAYGSLRGIFSTQEAAHIALNMGIENKPYIIKDAEKPTLADGISELELTTYMRNQLLRDSDVTSMAWGLELRVPFVDQVLIDTLSDIPASLRLRPGKKLLIESIPEIPEWVTNRPKQGFRFPFDEWFSQGWQEIPQPTLSPSWIKLKPWYRRWSLLVLNDWIKRYVK